MDKSWLIMCRAASSLTKMKHSNLDEPTAKRLRKLLYRDEIDIHFEEHKEEVDVIFGFEANEYDNENMIGFGVNPDFIKMLKNGEIVVELLHLPPLGQSIDGTTLPKVPPIKTLQGQIGICSTPFEKQLTTTDLEIGQGRLTICKMAVENILKPMLKKGEDLTLGIDVMVYDEKGREFAMRFKYWSDKMHVLTTGWKQFCLEKKFKACEDWVTIWMFRRNKTGRLCFAIIPRRFPITKLLNKVQKKGRKSVVKKEKGKEKKIYSSPSKE